MINRFSEYTGEEIEVEFEDFNEEIMELTGDTAAIDAGEYELSVNLKNTQENIWYLGEDEDGEILSTEPQTIKWWIEPKVNWAYINPQYECYMYNGEEQEWQGDIIGYNDSVEVLGNKAKDVGLYDVILRLKDKKNYIWRDGTTDDKTQEWEIYKAVPEMEILNRNQYVNSITPLNVLVTPAMTDGNITVLYSLKNGSGYSEELPTETGLYKVKVILSDDRNLYDWEIEDFLYIEDKRRSNGDVNLDNKVNSTDLQRLYTHLNGVNLITNLEQLGVADINGDGNINSTDLQRLYSHLNGSNPLKI